MKTDWDAAIEFVLKSEGAYTVDPKDPGGETVWGIARNRNPQWAGWALVDAIKVSPNFINTIATSPTILSSVKDFYKSNFWNPCRCDELPAIFAIPLFDSAVNQGVGTAIRFLQRALKIKDDGVFGPATMAAVLAAKPRAATIALARRLEGYHRLMMEKPNLEVYSLNWFHRVIELSQLVARHGD